MSPISKAMEAWQLRAVQGFEQRSLSCRVLLGELCADPPALSADGSRPPSSTSSPVRRTRSAARSRSSTPLGQRGRRPQSYAGLHSWTANTCPAVALAHLGTSASGLPSKPGGLRCDESHGGSSSSAPAPKQRSAQRRFRPAASVESGSAEAELAESPGSFQSRQPSEGEPRDSLSQGLKARRESGPEKAEGKVMEDNVKKGKAKGKGKCKIRGSNPSNLKHSNKQAFNHRGETPRMQHVNQRSSSSSCQPSSNVMARSKSQTDCSNHCRPIQQRSARRPDSARLELLSRPRHPKEKSESRSPRQKTSSLGARRPKSKASGGKVSPPGSPSRELGAPTSGRSPMSSAPTSDLPQARPVEMPCNFQARPCEIPHFEAPVIGGAARPCEDFEPVSTLSGDRSSWELLQTVRAELGSLAEVAGWAALSCKQTQPLAEALLGQVRVELLRLEKLAPRMQLPGTTEQICEIQLAARQAMETLQEALGAHTEVALGQPETAMVCQLPVAPRHSLSQSCTPEPSRQALPLGVATPPPLKCEAPRTNRDLGTCPAELSLASSAPSNSAVLAAALGDLAQGMRQALDEIHKVRGTHLESNAGSKLAMSTCGNRL
mmetsp:Transcript_4775/g.8474  ORF Transcript_4775/g.8474 Transcript_4775/m.8474 type:complete len:605 (-) Transcript_4775:89-1903(-)